jgi:hypothetical protein
MKKVTVRVPATTANLGPGFDAFGCALSLYTDVTFEETDCGLEITGCDEAFSGPDNLAYTAFCAVLASLSEVKSSTSATAEAAGNAQLDIYATALTRKEGKITSSQIDSLQAKVAFDQTGAITTDLTAPVQTKNQLGDNYGMRKASKIGKEWFEQAAGFAAFITTKTVAEATGIAVNEGGYPTDAELTATTTMGIGEFITLLNKIAQ